MKKGESHPGRKHIKYPTHPGLKMGLEITPLNFFSLAQNFIAHGSTADPTIHRTVPQSQSLTIH